MEKNMDWEQKTLINELTKGQELAKQLMNDILQPSSSSKESRDFLVEKILSSYEKALSVLTQVGEPTKRLESACSLGNTSPRSVIFDQDSKHNRDVFKKRKTLPRWTEQVRVCLGTGLDGPLEDGYSWRKYGQKEILGATHPRGYYRCTHRNAQGCLATKQVQRSDEDPSLLEVTYRGHHTCSRASELAMQIKQGFKAGKENHPAQQEGNPKQYQSTLLSTLKAGLEVKTEDLDTREDDIFQSFSFPSTPIEPENLKTNFFCDMIENTFAGSFSSPFLSPATSESTYFSVSPCHVTSSFGLINNNVHTSESDLTEILSAPTSVSNSPMGDLDLTLDKVDLELNFPFDSAEFFS